MSKLKSILLLTAMGIILFPWKMICIAHPFGHDHHHHEGPSPCELREQVAGTGPVYLPPMDCKHIDDATDEFKQPEKEQIKPSVQTLAIVLVTFDLVRTDYQQVPVQIPPEPRCRSAPVIISNPLRGPPSV
ncbi:MAG: hypothetical protein GVY19_09910 [Bacteroidetes bacterium]|jgi:hypothetical protein|nr:hypothetical protein [Bacteroidota bacterium]